MHAADTTDRMQEAIDAYCDTPSEETRETALSAIREKFAADRAAGIVPERLTDEEGVQEISAIWARVPAEKREEFQRRCLLTCVLFCDPSLDE